MAELKASGAITLAAVDASSRRTEEDLLITMTQMEGYVTENDQDVTVVLDTNLTAELLEEGFVRELVSKLQTMRKEAGFEVMDQIAVYYQGSEKVAGIFERNRDAISKEVLATSVQSSAEGVYQKEWNINGETVTLGVTKQ